MIARSADVLCALLNNGMLGKASIHIGRQHNAGGHITWTISWLASDPPFLGEAACHCVVQRRWPCGN